MKEERHINIFILLDAKRTGREVGRGTFKEMRDEYNKEWSFDEKGNTAVPIITIFAKANITR